MEIQKIEKTYGRSPQADALFDLMGKKSVHSIFLQGLLCSSAPMFFASLQGKMRRSVLFVLDDADEAGYFYHDLTQPLPQ
jgi:transcription-repair coupling factor (superfamily II helicase)